MRNADDDAVESGLATLGRLGDTEIDQHLARFRNRLRDLREDPAEAARIDALVAEAEREDQYFDAGSGNGLTIYVNGGVVHVSHGEGRAEAVRESAEERLAVLELELTRMRGELEAVRTRLRQTKTPRKEAPSRPRRTWETVLAPAFGNGVLVAILAAATVTTALHTATVALTIIGSVLAAATAAAALLSVWMPFASVRALNRRGDAALALKLLSRQADTPHLPGGARDDEEEAATGIAPPPETSPPLAFSRQRYLESQGDARRPGACPTCGSVVHEDDTYCQHCGFALSVVR
jgi:hypothetical protein